MAHHVLRPRSVIIRAPSSTSCVIEQTIGMLKMLFRCLDTSGGALQYAPARVSRIVMLCCALHNRAQQRGWELQQEQGTQPLQSRRRNMWKMRRRRRNLSWIWHQQLHTLLSGRPEYEQAERRWKEMEEKDILENLEREKREKQEKERAAQFLREAIERKEAEDQEQDTKHVKEREQQKVSEEEKDVNESLLDDVKEIGEILALSDGLNKAPSRLRRRYRFTEQIENLHQGLPVCKLSYATNISSKKRQDRQESKDFLDLGSSFNGYEPSFGKQCNRPNELRHQVGNGPSEKSENCLPSPSRNDKKNSLMETLFRSGATLENNPSKDSEAKATEKLKQLQRNKQTSRIQVTNKSRINVLDPDLLPVRVLESSTDESEKLVLQSLNK